MLGWAVTLIGVIGILLGVSAGLLATKLGLRRVFLGGLLLGAGVSALQGAGLNLQMFLASRVLEGVSHLAIVVAAPTLIAQTAPKGLRPFALTLWGTFFGVTFAAVAWLGRPLAETHGVGALFTAHAVWMLASAAVCWAVLPRAPTAPAVPRITAGWIVQRHMAIYRSPYLAAPAVAWLFYTFCFVSMITLLPAYLPENSRSFVVGLIPLATLISSMTLGNVLLRYVSAITVIQVSFVTTILSLLGLLVLPGSPVVAVIWAFFLGLAQGAGFAAVPELNADVDSQSQANGAMAQTGNLGNTIGTPVLLLAVAGAGYAGMIITSAVVLCVGVVMQRLLVRARNRHADS